jgi:6-phospho-3-hexuloisomerase
MNKLEAIINEIQSVTQKIDYKNIQHAVSLLVQGKRVFVIGEGRSGLMAKSFAMRLMHLGATVFVVGETITPAIHEGDVLIAVSGSGKTRSTVWTAEKAKEMKCEVMAVTANPESDLASAATFVLHVPAATKYRGENEQKSIQPLGSLFDQSIHILFDSICLMYSESKQVDHNQAFHQHSNLE